LTEYQPLLDRSCVPMAHAGLISDAAVMMFLKASCFTGFVAAPDALRSHGMSIALAEWYEPSIRFTFRLPVY